MKYREKERDSEQDRQWRDGSSRQAGRTTENWSRGGKDRGTEQHRQRQKKRVGSRERKIGTGRRTERRGDKKSNRDQD